jgi:hypothetical protein
VVILQVGQLKLLHKKFKEQAAATAGCARLCPIMYLPSLPPHPIPSQLIHTSHQAELENGHWASFTPDDATLAKFAKKP